MKNDKKMIMLNDEALENVVGGCFWCVLGADQCTGNNGKSLGSILQTFGKMLVTWTK